MTEKPVYSKILAAKKARSLAEEYLEKDSVTDNRRDTTPNRGHFITSTCLSGNFQSLTETFCNSGHSENSLKIKYTDSQNFKIPPSLRIFGPA
ncbi:hypothetical protein T4C_11446 [Trichinella pseudospiralis]|uniref:Uncharacterized protein n=1 Tax=Trichinella pseudospiralis TaxID=6337 RepID=A0A0V1F6E6_TRIPS|nr:hypothetical protein T4D_5186 [Trichinella pseudospiralis]KRY81770.1 hypothetical protein T4D_400 [Trichinella pseudospiralis]KRZ28876.1 hypothetical protein T4C_11446 [Trichinella pseudospiralis]